MRWVFLRQWNIQLSQSVCHQNLGSRRKPGGHWTDGTGDAPLRPVAFGQRDRSTHFQQRLAADSVHTSLGANKYRRIPLRRSDSRLDLAPGGGGFYPLGFPSITQITDLYCAAAKPTIILFAAAHRVGHGLRCNKLISSRLFSLQAHQVLGMGMSRFHGKFRTPPFALTGVECFRAAALRIFSSFFFGQLISLNRVPGCRSVAQAGWSID